MKRPELIRSIVLLIVSAAALPFVSESAGVAVWLLFVSIPATLAGARPVLSDSGVKPIRIVLRELAFDSIVFMIVLSFGAMRFGDSFGAMLLATLAILSFLACLRAISLLVPAGVVAAVALIWLAWPVWPAGLNQRVSPTLVATFHTGVVVTHTLSPESPFTHRPTMYTLSRLGQDVMIGLPASVWPCVAAHVLMGGVFAAVRVGVSSSRAGRPSESRTPPTP